MTDLIFDCDLDHGAVVFPMAGKQARVDIPEGEEPFGDWIIEKVLKIVRLAPKQKLVLKLKDVVKAEYSYDKVGSHIIMLG